VFNMCVTGMKRRKWFPWRWPSSGRNTSETTLHTSKRGMDTVIWCTDVAFDWLPM